VATLSAGLARSERPVARSSHAGLDVALIGYQDQGNLGMGYLASVLHERGRRVEMIDVRDSEGSIAERLLVDQPLVVGFSLIFQFFLPQFRRLAVYLRRAGVTSHFTIGGHYPSLCHADVLSHFPELDSVVRYEGELTLVDLVERISAGADWRKTPGVAYRDGDAIAESEQRALIADLDSLPFPYRPYQPERIVGLPTLSLLASRGCARRCSFCSIHTFYRTARGKVVRVRKPEKIIEEMLELHRDQGVRIFLFQDDDFPLWGRAGRRWVDELVDRMHDSGLSERTVWKISCRAEYVEPELFTKLKDAGLFLVYMGIESGVEQGLEVLHKQMTIEQNLTAVQVLKDVGLCFSYGFMLLDPSSTFDSVRQNIAFLREIVGDGYAAATFCRMLPYGGTPIRDRLEQEGRLRGDLTHPDYDFLDPRLNAYYSLLKESARPWIHDRGLSHEFNWAWEELATIERLVVDVHGVEAYREVLTSLTAEANEALFALVDESSTAFERGDRRIMSPAATRTACDAARTRLVAARDGFIGENADALLGEINRAVVAGPVTAPQVH
jgi:radical SAM superfamily enzyme YgiQ (UPF0313 family)